MPAKAGDEALAFCQYVLRRKESVQIIPCTTYTNLDAPVDDGEIVGLGSDVWEPATIRVVQTLEGVADRVEVCRHCSVLIRRSWETVRKATGREGNSSFWLDTVGTAHRCDILQTSASQERK